MLPHALFAMHHFAGKLFSIFHERELARTQREFYNTLISRHDAAQQHSASSEPVLHHARDPCPPFVRGHIVSGVRASCVTLSITSNIYVADIVCVCVVYRMCGPNANMFGV